MGLSMNPCHKYWVNLNKKVAKLYGIRSLMRNSSGGKWKGRKSERSEGREGGGGDQQSSFRWFPCVEELSWLRAGVVGH